MVYKINVDNSCGLGLAYIRVAVNDNQMKLIGSFVWFSQYKGREIIILLDELGQ